MHVGEVLEGGRKSRHHGGRVPQFDVRDVIALEPVNKALGHAAALLAALRRLER